MHYSRKTRPWVITVSILLIVLLYYLIIWLLIGEIDFLDKDYIVPANGILWSGSVTESNYVWVWEKYHTIKGWDQENCSTPSDFWVWWQNQDMDKLKIIALNSWFDPIILWYVFGGIILSLIYPFIFKLFRWGNFDMIPFTLTISIVCSIFFVTALIPYWGESNEFWREGLRMIIACICGLISFLIVNRIVNKFFITTKNAQILANELKSEKQAADVYNKELRKLIDNYRENDKEYIDLDDINNKK